MVVDSNRATPKSILTTPAIYELSDAADQPTLSIRQVLFTNLPAFLLTAVWAYVVIGLPGLTPSNPATIHSASWLAFLALLIAPGYWLGDLFIRTQRFPVQFDWLERLALAFPLGVAVLSVPGMIALLLHGTLYDLVTGWAIASIVLLAVWLIVLWRQPVTPPAPNPWTLDQFLLLLLIGVGFAVALPLLMIYKIDGDAYAVGSFTADALAGLPLNAREPLFGTNLGPGVRMTFNQSLPISYLWTYLSGVDAITMAAVASRAMVALWILLASYMLGKAVGVTHYSGQARSSDVGRGWRDEIRGRRFGLFVAAIQLLIFLVSPFLRDDNVALFFFERTTADKFMVPTVMLPVTFALTIRYLAGGSWRLWLLAAITAFAVSTIHPLIAAMLALALGVFAGFHWLLHLHSRSAFGRALAIGAVIVVTMTLPILQLVLSRGEAPLAPSFPTSVEGWPIGSRQIPVLPYFYLSSLDVYGPMPDFTQLKASDANATTNPFLVGRFAVNMARRRLILFDLTHYIADPNLLLEPPYLLALLCLPFLFYKIRRNLGAQFAVSTSLAILFVMFNPYITPLIGELVMPWILWRFVWLLPYALILALTLFRLVGGEGRSTQGKPTRFWQVPALSITLLLITVALSPTIFYNWRTIKDRAAFPYYYPTPTRIFTLLRQLTSSTEPVTVLADQDVSVTLAAYVARANVVAHRAPTISEIFPADQQSIALQRLIDQATFYRNRYLSKESLAILQRYDVRYVIAESGSNLDLQLRLAPQWFQAMLDDQSYSLYYVEKEPTVTAVIEGNSFAAQRLWERAEQSYLRALDENPSDTLALVGLAEIAHAQGRFNEAISRLQAALAQSEQPALRFRLGELYAELGQTTQSIDELTLAQQNAPTIARFNLALGDACLRNKDNDCASTQFALAIANGDYDASGEVAEVSALQTQSANELPQKTPSHLIALADLWRQRGELERALPLYQQAVELQPSLNNQLILASVWQEQGNYTEAATLISTLQRQHPLSTEIRTLLAELKAKQGQLDEAVAGYRRAIQLQDLQGQETHETRLALAKLLAEHNRLDEARTEVALILQRQPNNAFAYGLQGEIALRQNQAEEATQSLQQAFRLDPSNVGVFVALSNQLQTQGGRQDEMFSLLQRAMQANPNQAILALALGDQAETDGDLLTASNAYLAALDQFEEDTDNVRANPTNVRLSQAYTYARLAQVREKLGENDAAINYYNAAVSAAPAAGWTQIMLGSALRRQGNLGAARNAFKQALAIDPDSLDPYLQLADLSMVEGNSAAAESYRQRALALVKQQLSNESTPLTTTTTILTSGHGASKLEEPVSAAAQSDETQTASATPKGSGNDALLAQLLASGRLAQAKIEDLNIARSLARLYQEAGQPQLAERIYRQLLEIGTAQNWTPTTLAQLHTSLGDLYLSERSPTLARQSYEQALQLNQWSPQAHLSLARVLSELADDQAALTQLRVATQLAPGYIEAQVAMAHALLQVGASEEATTNLTNLAQLYPGNEDIALAIAQIAQGENDLEAASAGYRTMIEANPNNVAARLGLATIQIEQKQYGEARGELTRTLEVDPGNINAMIQRGIIEQTLGDSQQALAWFEKATTLSRNDPRLVTLLLNWLERAGSYEVAIQYVQNRLEAQPNDPTVLRLVEAMALSEDLTLRQARIQRTLGNYNKAFTILLQAEKNGLLTGSLAAELGELYQTQGRLMEAIGAFRLASRLQPQEPTYALRLSQLWLTQGNVDQALTTLQGGLGKANQPAPLYAALARLYLQIAQPDQASIVLEQARVAIGDQPELLLAMGEYTATKSIADAETWYDATIATHPELALLHAALGDLYAQDEKLEQAIGQYQTALTLEPQNVRLLLNFGKLYEQAKEPAESFKLYQQAVDLEPTLGESYLRLAQLAQQQGDWETAQSWLDKGLKVAPTEGRLYVEMGALLTQQEKGDEAKAKLVQATQVEPTADTLRTRAALYLKLKRPKEARLDLEAALKLEPGSVETRLSLRQIYLDLGETVLAKEQLNAALKLAPGIVDAE